MKMFIDIVGDFLYSYGVLQNGNGIIPTYYKCRKIKMRKTYQENYESTVLYNEDSILWTDPLIQDE